MKMSVGTRVLLSIFLIVIIAALVYILCAMFGVVPPDALEGVFATALRGGFWYKFLYAAICVVLIIVALILLFFHSKREGGEIIDHQKTITIANLQGGEIVMTTKAVEDLVQREVQQTSGIRSSSTKVLSGGDYVDVICHMAIRNGENIPDLTKGLHDKLESELVNQLGVTPRTIDITVTDVSDAVAAETATGKLEKKARRVI